VLNSDALVEHLLTIRCQVGATRLFIIGIDGPDCAGKSTLARSLSAAIPEHYRSLHLDEYVDTRVLGLDRESMSLETFLTSYFPTEVMAATIRESAVTCQSQGVGCLVVEGMFLCRPQIRQQFDYLLRLEISESLVLKRALARDVGVLGPREWVVRHYLGQCIPAQRIYRSIAEPAIVANDVAVFLEEQGAWELRAGGA